MLSSAPIWVDQSPSYSRCGLSPRRNQLAAIKSRHMNKSELIQRYARAGALTRLAELKAEIAQIESAFPDLAGNPVPARRGPRRPRAAETQTAPAAPKRKRTMSAAARKAIGDAQRKRWAEQKAQGAKKR
jgi:hypothetical protein